jgi:DNA replication protein DnaC
MAAKHNLILVGGTGTGKTHGAIAIGSQAIRLGKRVRFYSVVNPLEVEQQRGQPGRLARLLAQVDAVILDELGALPCSPSGGALLFLETGNDSYRFKHRSTRS